MSLKLGYASSSQESWPSGSSLHLLTKVCMFYVGSMGGLLHLDPFQDAEGLAVLVQLSGAVGGVGVQWQKFPPPRCTAPLQLGH